MNILQNLLSIYLQSSNLDNVLNTEFETIDDAVSQLQISCAEFLGSFGDALKDTFNLEVFENREKNSPVLSINFHMYNSDMCKFYSESIKFVVQNSKLKLIV